MSKSNATNERIKREYFIWLKQAHGRSDGSVDAAAQALSRFEAYTRHRDFKKFHVQQAVGFKDHLLQEVKGRNGQNLSLATVSANLAQVKAFFLWHADKPGYRRVVTHADTAYFNLTDRDERISTVSTERPKPTIEQLLRVLEAMPSDTVVERRDRAVVAFALLTGARDGTFPGLRLKHVDLDKRVVHFDPREVHTKFGKDLSTSFLPVPGSAEVIVRAWMEELNGEHLFGSDDPLFPQTLVGLDDEHRFGVRGIARNPWQSASPVREIFKKACARVGLPYFNPHGVRHALATLSMKLCATPEEMKAWSQNLGHEHVLTTLRAYGKVPAERQAAIIGAMRGRSSKPASGLAGDTLAAIRLILDEAERQRDNNDD